MKINLSNFETSDVSLFDVSIVQRDVGGGKTEKEDIDCLEEYPTAKSLIISGLNRNVLNINSNIMVVSLKLFPFGKINQSATCHH